MTTKISANAFSGTGQVFDGTLAAAVRGMAQNIAVKAASGVADFTADNSGGSAGSTIANVTRFTLSAVGSNNAVAKAEAETAAGGVVDGLMEIVAKAQAVNAVVGAFGTLTDSMGGTAADGTIAAIDVSATGAGSSLASAAGMNTLYDTLRSRTVQAAYYVNALCRATGQTELTVSIDNALYTAAWGTTFAAVSTDTGTAVDGSDALEANACVLKTEWDAAQVVFANAIASMAAKLDAMTADANATAVCSVVAS